VDILVVSEHAALRDALAAALREALGGVAVHHAEGHAHALAQVRRIKQLGLVLLDLAVNGSAGIETLMRFREKYPHCRIVAFSATTEDRGLILSALHAGAAGYLSKQCAPNVKLAALRLVAAGGTYLPPEVLPQQIRVPVTARQRDVLRLLLKGYGNRRIASELAISESTVKQHAYAVYDALGVSSRAQLIATAARRGIHAD
jgi:DNA-binding NarL/FixJ family response regulator